MTPVFGAIPEPGGVRFTVPVGPPHGSVSGPRDVELVVCSGRARGSYELHTSTEGIFESTIPGAAPGDRYGYRLDGGELRPDPASRCQPDGVHGPSEIVDPTLFRWTDRAWQGRGAREAVVYELHVGAFTAEGTFEAARRKLPFLRDLGVTHVELLPIAEFAGTRNWGYDGVGVFAPARTYGRPDDLRAFVDDAHAHGLGVILDVVYNHLGPEGAYLTEFVPQYITTRHATPWGGAVNLDGCGSALVRRFILDNAAHWIREYHLDGLRLDATHALIDSSPTHVVAELAETVRREARWPVAIHAEDHRNLSAIVEPRDRGGWGLDGIWADDFHHIVRRMTAGDAHGYYGDFDGTEEELARTIRQGWLYTGQPTKRTRECRGTDASRVPMRHSVICLQNHDQVGNRATGDRLHHRIESSAWRAATLLLLTSPMTPLLFMGQEWSASTPFLFFTDLEPELGRAVTEGRRREFKDFPGFDPQLEVPDPQAAETFERSTLRWDERREPEHASTLALHSALLALRAAHAALQASDCCAGEAWAEGAGIVMRRRGDSEAFVVAASLRGPADVDCARALPDGCETEVLLTTEDAAFAPDPQPPRIGPSCVGFQRAGAVLIRCTPR